MPNHFSWTLDTHAKLENMINVKLLIFSKLTYYSIIVELHCIGNHYKLNWFDRVFFVIVKLTYLIRDFVTNASILVIRFTIFPVFCFAMLKLSSLINFDKLEFTLYVAWGVPEVNWRSKPKAFWSKYSLLCQLFGWVEPSISRLNFKTSNVLLVRKEYIHGELRHENVRGFLSGVYHIHCISTYLGMHG